MCYRKVGVLFSARNSCQVSNCDSFNVLTVVVIIRRLTIKLVSMLIRLWVGRFQNRGSIPGEGKEYFSTPQLRGRLWSVCSSLSKGNWALSRGRQSGGLVNPAELGRFLGKDKAVGL
jgi:hypothetical protein